MLFTSLRVTNSSLAALQFLFLDDELNARLWANKTVNFGLEYFLGNWRSEIPSGDHYDKPPNREWWNVNASWNSEFTACALWGSVLGRWADLSNLAVYVTDESRIGVDQSPSNLAWLILVAGVLHGRPLTKMEHVGRIIMNSKRKREILLFRFLDSVCTGTDANVDHAATEFFKWYKSREWKSTREMTKKVTADGTFLVHFAEHLGRTVSLPTSIVDHIVRLPAHSHARTE
jgi:hypothetical protein